MSGTSPGNLIIVTAPSGAGKTTLVARMIERIDKVKPSISYTARAARPGERDGRDYHFVNREEFLKMIERNEFLEWAEVHGNLYGTSIRAVDDARRQGFDVVATIDVQGAALARKLYPEAIGVFVLPPTREALESRLETRGSETEESRRLRLQNARHELAQADQFDYIVINEDLERATEELVAIVRSERCRTKLRNGFVQDLTKEFTGS